MFNFVLEQIQAVTCDRNSKYEKQNDYRMKV